MTPRETSSALEVVVENRQSDHDVDVQHLREFLSSVLVDQGVGLPAEVGLAFVDAAEMTDLNQVHMGGAGPTDVLAFPIDGTTTAPQGQPALLGDIVVCPSVASQSAQPLGDELALLVVHGALHLLGHDHAEPGEAAVMKSLERSLLERFHTVR